MYKIKYNEALNTLEIQDPDKSLYGKIHLNAGASLQELTLNGNPIIQDLSPLPYDSTYASSILFPFANRIKDGAYEFKGKAYQFEINQKEENNALHGLVYNKSFKIVKQEAQSHSASIVLEYVEDKASTGFPYTYSIQVTYIFKADALQMELSVKNTSSNDFPFTLGWHPYFISDNLHNSTLSFDCNKKIVIGERNITTGVEDIKPIKAFKIEDQQLDDCWILNSDKIVFSTPSYDLTFGSSDNNNFMQAYTPPRLNTIAIEPTTGVSDSFNNNIGLQILKANNIYKIIWDLSITNK
ncbi:aldose 1-epimerase [Algibacter mikhailovii]|uniref:aldose 1-epimerase n=1 Tax=Algibacter mikhailovii TaxID=425498 RepID=UPI002494E678|nr:aldose 1-epimerase [Algibacter mikhailovii]